MRLRGLQRRNLLRDRVKYREFEFLFLSLLHLRRVLGDVASLLDRFESSK